MIKRVFLIAGMSESGKSSCGRYLETMGIPRLKIISFLKDIMEREGAIGSFVDWNNKNVLERPEWVHQEFTKEFVARMSVDKIEYCALESLYSPELGVYMKSILGDDNVVIVYIDMDVNVRIQRQMIRENLVSMEEAKAFLLPRDEIKKAWRVPEIKNIADVIIDNSGTIEELHQKVKEMVNKYCPKYI